MILRGWRIRFHPPNRSALLLLDSDLGKQYSRILLDDFSYVQIDPRPGRTGSIFYVSPIVIVRVIRRLVRSRSGGSGWNWKKRLAYCYFAALLEIVQPRVVLSLRGGFTLWFSELAREFAGVAFVAVAPAQVHKAQLRTLRPSPVQYFVYGEYDREQLARIGEAGEQVHAVGPLVGGYFQHVGWGSAQRRYDICIPSQVVELALEDSKRAEASDRSTLLYIQRRLAEYTSRFARENGLRVAIALRPQEPSLVPGGERRFFEQHMDCDYEIIESHPEEFSTYHAIAASHVVVTHCSTTGFEVLSWPKKVLFCEFKPYDPFRIPEGLDWAVRTDEYAEFARTLQRLLEMSDAEYAERIEPAVRHFNGYRDSAPPHSIIGSLLRDLSAGPILAPETRSERMSDRATSGSSTNARPVSKTLGLL